MNQIGIDVSNDVFDATGNQAERCRNGSSPTHQLATVAVSGGL